MNNKKKLEHTSSPKTQVGSIKTNKRLKSNTQEIEEFIEIETKLSKLVTDEIDPFHASKKSPKAFLSSLISKTPTVSSAKKPFNSSHNKEITETHSKKNLSGTNTSLKSLALKETYSSNLKAVPKLSQPYETPHIKKSGNPATRQNTQPKLLENQLCDISLIESKKEAEGHAQDDHFEIRRVSSINLETDKHKRQDPAKPKYQAPTEDRHVPTKHELLDLNINEEESEADVVQQCTDIKTKVNLILAKYKIALDPNPPLAASLSQDVLRPKAALDTSPRSRDSSRILKDIHDSLNDSPVLALDAQLAAYTREIRRHVNQEILKVSAEFDSVLALVARRKAAAVQALRAELDRVLASMAGVPAAFTLHHFSIVPSHKADLEAALDRIFPRLAITVDPSFYELSGPGFETGGGFSDNVLFTRTSCGSFSQELDLSRGDALGDPDKPLLPFLLDPPSPAVRGSALGNIYSPTHNRRLADSPASLQKTQPRVAETAGHGQWKKRAHPRPALRLQGLAKTQEDLGRLPSRDSRDSALRTPAKLSPLLRGPPDSERDRTQPKEARRRTPVPDLFGPDALARLTEESPGEECSASPGLLRPVQVPESPALAKSQSQEKRRRHPLLATKGFRSTAGLRAGLHHEERQSAPALGPGGTKSQSPAKVQVSAATGQIDLYTEEAGRRWPTTPGQPSKSGSLAGQLGRKARGTKAVQPLFKK